MTDGAGGDLVTVTLPGNRLTAELIHRACRAEGIECELLTADASGWYRPLVGYERHRLLVRRADRDRVMLVISRTVSLGLDC
jgi:hypothetical protein